MKKNILLTGSSGFVGGNFKNRHADEFNFETASLQLTAPENLSYEGIDSIVHCAALVHQMNGAPDEAYDYANFQLTKKFADCAKLTGVGHFVYISTAHVYGDSGQLYDHHSSLSENSVCAPKDAYGKSKLKAEKYLISIQSPNFIVSIIRPPMVYGKGAKGNIISLAKLIKYFPILPLNFNLNKRSIIFVGNLCQYIALIIQGKSGGIFLPQDPAPVSIKTLVEEIAFVMNKRIYLFAVPRPILYIFFRIVPKISSRLFGTLALDSKNTNQLLEINLKFNSRQGLEDLLNN